MSVYVIDDESNRDSSVLFKNVVFIYDKRNCE